MKYPFGFWAKVFKIAMESAHVADIAYVLARRQAEQEHLGLDLFNDPSKWPNNKPVEDKYPKVYGNHLATYWNAIIGIDPAKENDTTYEKLTIPMYKFGVGTRKHRFYVKKLEHTVTQRG